jgi:hypothetical protein
VIKNVNKAHVGSHLSDAFSNQNDLIEGDPTLHSVNTDSVIK